MPLFPRSPSPPLLHLRKESDHEAHLRSIHAGEVGLMFVLKQFRIEVGVGGLAVQVLPIAAASSKHLLAVRTHIPGSNTREPCQ